MTGHDSTRRAVFAGAVLALPGAALAATAAASDAGSWRSVHATYTAALERFGDASTAEDEADMTAHAARPPLPAELIYRWRKYGTEEVFTEELTSESVIRTRFAAWVFDKRRERALGALQDWQAQCASTPAYRTWEAAKHALDHAMGDLDAAFARLMARPAPTGLALAQKIEAICNEGRTAEQLAVVAADARRLGRA